MTAMSVLWIVWASLLAGTIALFLYRATLTLHENEELFLSELEYSEYERRLQEALMRKVERLKPYITGMTGATGLATVVLVGIYTLDAIKTLTH